MTSWTTRVLLGAMTLLASTALPAQDAPVSSAVLVGVQGCTGDNCSGRSTLLVVRQGDTVRRVASGGGLLVPRRDGFWWLGLHDGFAGSPPADYDDAARLAECDSVVLGLKPSPSDSAPATMQTEEDETEGEPVWQSAMWLARADATGSPPVHVLRTTRYGSLALQWVGSEHFAMSEHSVHYGDYERVSEEYEERIYPFAEFLRPRIDDPTPTPWEPQGATFSRLERACRREVLGPVEDPEERASLDDRSRVMWTVRRDRTSWRLMPLLEVPWVTDVPTMPCTAPRGLGAEMVGHDRVTVAWSAIKEVLPEATTAFQSPAGDLLLVVQDMTLHAFLPRAGSLGAVVARFPIEGEVVMAQWAVAPHAARWGREVPPLLAKGPPVFVPDSVAGR